MKILHKTETPRGIARVELWSLGDGVEHIYCALYCKAKTTARDEKRRICYEDGEEYRFQFDFDSVEEAKAMVYDFAAGKTIKPYMSHFWPLPGEGNAGEKALEGY